MSNEVLRLWYPAPMKMWPSRTSKQSPHLDADRPLRPAFLTFSIPVSDSPLSPRIGSPPKPPGFSTSRFPPTSPRPESQQSLSVRGGRNRLPIKSRHVVSNGFLASHLSGSVRGSRILPSIPDGFTNRRAKLEQSLDPEEDDAANDANQYDERMERIDLFCGLETLGENKRS